METVGGPDAKKARWSPTSFGAAAAANGANGLAANASAASGNRNDAFANYGYGPQAGIAQNGGYNNSPSSAAAFNGNPLYSTPTLTLNTAVASNGMPSQMSPNTAGPYTPQNQQPQSANPNSANPYNFNGYNMLGMGLPTMGVLGGFGYNGQMAANFAQVSSPYLVCYFTLFVLFIFAPSLLRATQLRWREVDLIGNMLRKHVSRLSSLEIAGQDTCSPRFVSLSTVYWAHNFLFSPSSEARPTFVIHHHLRRMEPLRRRSESVCWAIYPYRCVFNVVCCFA